jgi:hypothetical protein
MSLSPELRSHSNEASGLEAYGITISESAPLHYQIALATLVKITRDELQRDIPEYKMLLASRFERLLPLINLIQEEKSILEHLGLKRKLSQFISSYSPKSKNRMTTPTNNFDEVSWTVVWLEEYLPAIGLFPTEEIESLQENGPQETWKRFESQRLHETTREGKIPQLGTIFRTLRKNKETNIRTGIAMVELDSTNGESLGRYLESARGALGVEGYLAAIIYKGKLTGEEEFLQWVDEAILSEEIPAKYGLKNIIERLSPNLLFIKYSSSSFKPALRVVALQANATLLWNNPQGRSIDHRVAKTINAVSVVSPSNPYQIK